MHARGKAGLRWCFGWGRNEFSVSNRKVGDPAEGTEFDVRLKFTVREGTEDKLSQRSASSVRDADIGSGMTEDSYQARQAIAEMAPPFLEKTRLGN